ncbi:MAG: acetoacetate decarboxylase family protein [Deltaproteobacteria bacterium]|nr:acetoacetate decarboxylase family protein [Candidatus Zymogenaceae bacterium]
MKSFFSGTRPGKPTTVGGEKFDLPILYYRDDAFALFYTAEVEKVAALMPSDKLHPIVLWGKRALFGVACFNYIDTTIGPYGEVGIVVPAFHADEKPPYLIPAIRETYDPRFGMVVLHLPVTNTMARDGGRGVWGYTKFVADMKFVITPEYMECRLSEGKKHILTARVARRGFVKKDYRPLSTFSVKDKNLIQTTIPQVGTTRNSFFPDGSFLDLGDHEITGPIRDLGLSAKPFMSRYYLERSGILPEGKVIQANVRDMDGYRGTDRDGEHTVVYHEK